MAVCGVASMVVRPVTVGRCQVRRYRIGLASSVALQCAALTDTLIGMNVRTGRHFLQENLDRLGACRAFEGKGAGGLGHRHFLGLLVLLFLLVLVLVLCLYLCCRLRCCSCFAAGVNAAAGSSAAPQEHGPDFITRIASVR